LIGLLLAMFEARLCVLQRRIDQAAFVIRKPVSSNGSLIAD